MNTPTLSSAPAVLYLIAAELEAEILFGNPPESPAELVVAGVGRRGDERARTALARTRADLVLNVGLAGGLSPAAPVGSVHRVQCWRQPEGELCAGSAAAAAQVGDWLQRAGLPWRDAAAITVDTPAGTPDARRRLARSGAELVEMEGAVWAAAAHERGLPFVAIRVVSDLADAGLPEPRHLLLKPTGGVHWQRWLRGVAGADVPWTEAWQRLQRARRDWRTALQQLECVGAALAAGIDRARSAS